MSYLRRLLLLLLPIGMMILICGWLYWWGGQIRAEARNTAERSLPSVVLAGEINSDQAEGFIRALLMMESGNPEEVAGWRRQLDVLSAKVTRDIEQYAWKLTSAEDRQAYDHLLSSRKRYHEIRQQFVTLLQNGRKDEARALLRASLVSAYTEYTDAGDVLFHYNIQVGEAATQRIVKLCSYVQFGAVGAGIALFVIGCVAPFLVGYSVYRWVE